MGTDVLAEGMGILGDHSSVCHRECSTSQAGRGRLWVGPRKLREEGGSRSAWLHTEDMAGGGKGFGERCV